MLKALLALVGWMYLLFTTDKGLLAAGGIALMAGCGVFLVWSWRTKKWPF